MFPCAGSPTAPLLTIRSPACSGVLPSRSAGIFTPPEMSTWEGERRRKGSKTGSDKPERFAGSVCRRASRVPALLPHIPRHHWPPRDG